ncbi:DUF6585 family protein [Micromonospora sp. NPDC049559]|uniref:DUF6585 family protein n=1 Tax=Micromonospora sp. NPDC049559 TaxID=3155923 RepID=UPI00342E8B34
MTRHDDVPVPPAFLAIARERSLGAPIRVMAGGSRLQAVRGKLMTVGVFEQGVVVAPGGDAEPFHFRYDEVERFTQQITRKYVNGGYRGTDIMCWFGLRDGRGYRVGGETTRTERHIADDFRELVDPRITAAQLPGMRAALRQGGRLEFGPYAIEPDGLSVAVWFNRNRKRLGWAEIEKIDVDRGNVKVTARGRRIAWGLVSVHRVPNLRAFLTLVHEAGRLG